jgi:hypothetical protein
MDLPKTTEKKPRPPKPPENEEGFGRDSISEFEMKEKDLRRQLSEKESELEEVKSK